MALAKVLYSDDWTLLVALALLLAAIASLACDVLREKHLASCDVNGPYVFIDADVEQAKPAARCARSVASIAEAASSADPTTLLATRRGTGKAETAIFTAARAAVKCEQMLQAGAAASRANSDVEQAAAAAKLKSAISTPSRSKQSRSSTPVSVPSRPKLKSATSTPSRSKQSRSSTPVSVPSRPKQSPGALSFADAGATLQQLNKLRAAAEKSSRRMRWQAAQRVVTYREAHQRYEKEWQEVLDARAQHMGHLQLRPPLPQFAPPPTSQTTSPSSPKLAVLPPPSKAYPPSLRTSYRQCQLPSTAQQQHAHDAAAASQTRAAATYCTTMPRFIAARGDDLEVSWDASCSALQLIAARSSAHPRSPARCKPLPSSTTNRAEEHRVCHANRYYGAAMCNNPPDPSVVPGACQKLPPLLPGACSYVDSASMMAC